MSSAKARSPNSVWVSYMSGSSHVLEQSLSTSNGAHQQETRNRREARPNTGTLIWDVSIPSSILNPVPNTHPTNGFKDQSINKNPVYM